MQNNMGLMQGMGVRHDGLLQTPRPEDGIWVVQVRWGGMAWGSYLFAAQAGTAEAASIHDGPVPWHAAADDESHVFQQNYMWGR